MNNTARASEIPKIDMTKGPIYFTNQTNKSTRNKENPNRTGVSFFKGAPSLASYDASEYKGPPLQNMNIKNRFRNLPMNNGMYKTQNHFATAIVSPAAIAEISTSKDNSSRAPIGTSGTYHGSSVHERRCKVEDQDELLMQSREGQRAVASRDSKQSEIRSRISGKQTADSKKEREKLGPGDDQMIKMRVLNSYKQIKFSGVGIGGRPTVFSRHGEMAPITEQQKLGNFSHSYGANQLAKIAQGDDMTRRDSIYPSDLDGEDQQTQTMFEPFQTTDNFNSTGMQVSKKRGKTIPQKTYQFDES